jgi:carboxypeptidase T
VRGPAPTSRVVPIALLAALAAAAPATAARPLLRTNAQAADSAAASCIDHRRSGPSIATRRLTAPRTGYLTARLNGGRGDWDLAVFARGQSAPVAESAYRGSVEVAAGFVKRGQRLTVQACRRSGGAASARLRVVLERAKLSRAHLSAVRVFTPTPAHARALSRLDLDVTDRVDPHSSDVVLHGRRDRMKLIRAGLTYKKLALPRGTEKRGDFAIAALPGGVRTTYRRLADYSAEMKALAEANPDLVKPFTLGHNTWLGRPVEGLEITANPNARDGKPVLLMLGLHHAREWPSGEHTLEWAYELVQRYRGDSANVRSLLAHARVIVVPVTNPDGFNFSREDGQVNGHAGGTTGFDPSKPEDHRKNCRTSCLVNGGVDINRNYGDRWGGEGGTESPMGETYRGPSPFSEPEAQNIRELISGQQVVTMITNHTFGNEILRQPGAEDDFPTPDEPLYKSLGDEMAGEAGYTSIVSYELYAPNDHVGTTDGWSYFTTGGLGYVIESMPNAFHPPYAQVVQHYEVGSGNGGTAEGLRGAFYSALASSADAARHSVIRGNAPAGAVLRLTKSFSNRTSIGPPTQEHFESTLDVPASGQFEWHVNASGRPLFPAEQWTLTCERPEHTVVSTRQVSVARGQAVQVDLADCAPQPQPQPQPKPATPKLVVKLKATRAKKTYRGHVRGRLVDVDPGRSGENCAGKLTIQLRAAGKRVRQRRASLDAVCAYDETLSFRRSALPRKVRKKGVKRLSAVVQWGGSAAIPATQGSAGARVKRRR